MTIDSPVSANLNGTEPVSGVEAEGNCVAVRRGGKQPEAKEQSQMQMNSIRCAWLASLLASGEACAEHERSARGQPARAQLRNRVHGWSGNAAKEVYVNGESCGLRRWGRPCRPQQSEPSYELGSPVTGMEQREAGR